MRSAYISSQLFFGDIHNHCGISYGHGTLEDALANARERLDFVSITGHAHWPDMPDPYPAFQDVIDYHVEGFARLKRQWPAMMRTLRDSNEEGRFVVFPAFEVHFSASGDRNILYRDLEGEILYPTDLEDLYRQLGELRRRGVETLAQPHHVGYRRGTRGIDWATFDPEFAPVVELISMHGCSEASDTARPFLHGMGPSDWQGTIQYGLAQDHVFGVTGGTDHHSAHPGSYGHGLTGVWAAGCTREALWKAFYDRRTYALTGDRIRLEFEVDGQPMGAVVEPADDAAFEIVVEGGAALDCVDLIRNNQLLRRFSQYDFSAVPPQGTVRTKLHLELGWGPRDSTTDWTVEFGIDAGRVVSVEPRFRGRQVLAPGDAEQNDRSMYTARVLESSDHAVTFCAVSEGNPTNFTSNTQGLCLEVEMPQNGTVVATINGKQVQWPLAELLQGARSGRLGGAETASYRINRAPLPHELCWETQLQAPTADGDVFYVRVRQKNDQWAWSSPIFVRSDCG